VSQKLEASRAAAAKRVVIVTGGVSGMGLGAARHLAEAGHPVAIFDLQEHLFEGALAELRAVGGPALAFSVDVTNRDSVDAATEAVRKQLGPVSIIITSAGISGSSPFTKLTQDDWGRMLAINLTGTFNCIQSAIPDMLAAGWGRVITISSSSAQSGVVNRAHYAASKGGVIALTKALAMELSPSGITVNTIPPSIIDTPMARGPAAHRSLDAVAAITPVRRVGTADDIGAACLFLCSDDAGFITGQQIGVNGGLYL
jgi:2-hydroxycyclohexanecarboxyl-CoA dehydrogenase